MIPTAAIYFGLGYALFGFLVIWGARITTRRKPLRFKGSDVFFHKKPDDTIAVEVVVDRYSTGWLYDDATDTLHDDPPTSTQRFPNETRAREAVKSFTVYRPYE